MVFSVGSSVIAAEPESTDTRIFAHSTAKNKAGEYAVLVSDSSAFAARFGSAGFLRLRVSDDD